MGSSLSGKEILLVDDAADIQLIGKKILENEGAVVYGAVSVEKAKEILEFKIPHIMIVDLQMPVETGFDLLAYRASKPELKAVPALVMSGLKDRESVMKSISLGASDYLLKPIRNTSLLQKVRKILKVSGTYKYKFAPGQQPDVQLSLNAEITGLSEVGLDLSIPAKLAPGSPVQLTSDLLVMLDLKDTLLRNSLQGAKYKESGFYTHQVNFLGIGDDVIRRIKDFMRGLK